MVSRDRFTKYRETLSGLTPDNITVVKNKLKEMGFQFGSPLVMEEGVGDTEMEEAEVVSKPQAAQITEVASQVATIVAAVCKEVVPDVLSGVLSLTMPDPTPDLIAHTWEMPEWAIDCVDKRTALRWDENQTVAMVALN